jgi:ABC-type sulfate/molybdate transport systems ATPase subunit
LDKTPDQREKAMRAIEAVGLSALSAADASKLSGGETQRMAFARIIALPRKLLLLDEPTAATDLTGVDLMEAALLEYCAAHKCSVIFSTHSPAQAMRLADEVIFLNQGQIVEHAPAAQVLNTPQSPEAQAFLKHWKL